jgi:2-haloacid dehalogenase
MMISRRKFVALATAAMAGIGTSCAVLPTGKANRTRVVAFDALAIFDPRSVAQIALDLFPERASELMASWRTRQFEYTWLRSTADRYADFWKTTRDALIFAGRSLGIELPADKVGRLMQGFLELRAYPDVPAALASLKSAGFRLAIVSDFTHAMLIAGVGNSHLDGVFDALLSTDLVQVYKPAPAAYRMAMNSFGVDLDAVTFVPSAAWDAAGSRWFGYNTFWLNRQKVPAEELDVVADATADHMAGLLTHVGL